MEEKNAPSSELIEMTKEQRRRGRRKLVALVTIEIACFLGFIGLPLWLMTARESTCSMFSALGRSALPFLIVSVLWYAFLAFVIGVCFSFIKKDD